MSTAQDQWGLPGEPVGIDRGRMKSARPKHLKLVPPAPTPAVIVEMTIAEYLATEPQSEVRREYVGGFVYAMAGASVAHGIIELNIAVVFRALASEHGCRAFASGLKLRLDLANLPADKARAYYLPDVILTCSKNDMRRKMDIIEPSVLVEILSPGTSTTDRGTKQEHYLSIPSLQQYWLVHQDKMRVDVYTRTNRGWLLQTWKDPGDTIPISGVDGSITLADIYIDVDLSR